MRISIIVAIGKRGQIGLDNQLLWHHSEDLKNFKRLTLGHPILMGRKTFESIGKPLPKRVNIVLTRNEMFTADGVCSFTSLEEGIAYAKKEKAQELFIIGGGIIYDRALPFCDRLYVTHVDYEGDADTYFPSIPDDQFQVIEERSLEGSPRAQFKIYQRRELS